ncbi:cold-shock protein [Camelimonas abortus]|uniref:cold-shock protein n=1 Tax=Camelimonas abortus TaxID=1017184 RepID=UPI0035EBE8F1
MSRDNDYRDRRRFRDNAPDPWAHEMAPPMPSRPSYSRQQDFGGPEVGATVKWFNAQKGFGFVQLSDGSGEAFLHIRPVEAAGYSTLEPGTTLTVRIGQGQKGAQVTQVIDVDTSTAEPPRPRFGDRGPRSGGGFGDRPRRPGGRFFDPSVLEGVPEEAGVVKWFNPERGFGFIALERGGKDVFVHQSALTRSGIGDLQEGQQVIVKLVEGPKGPEAGSIQLG